MHASMMNLRWVLEVEHPRWDAPLILGPWEDRDSADSLLDLGLHGWEIVTSVPATTGIPLLNGANQHQSYGGGIGGLIEGVYLVLKFVVTKELLTDRRTHLENMLREIYQVHKSIPTAQQRSVNLTPGYSNPPAPGSSAGGNFVAFGMSRTVFADSETESDDGGGDFDFG